MKLLYALSIIVIVMAVTVEPNIEEKAEEQMHHSEVMCDSAAMVLDEMRHYNDSLLVQKYFYENK